MKITIHGRIISKKNNWHPTSRGGQVRIIPSKRWSLFESDVVEQIRNQLTKPKLRAIDSPVYIDYAFMMKGKGATDTSNMITAIDDLLQKSGVIVDDRLVRAGSFRVFEQQPEYVTEVHIKRL